MYEQIRKDILTVLNELCLILGTKEKSDILQMKQLSNHVIHNASIFQDEDSISIAILAYSLSKIIERKQMAVDYVRIIKMIRITIDALKENKDDQYRKSVKSIFDFVKTLDRGLRLYIHEAISQARIKKGSKIWEHGISVARVSEVLGVSQWELMHYLGKTTIIDSMVEPISVSNRLKIARELFQ